MTYLSGYLLCWTLLSASPNDTSPSGMCLGLLGSSLSGSGSGSSSSSSSSWYPGAWGGLSFSFCMRSFWMGTGILGNKVEYHSNLTIHWRSTSPMVILCPPPAFTSISWNILENKAWIWINETIIKGLYIGVALDSFDTKERNQMILISINRAKITMLLLFQEVHGTSCAQSYIKSAKVSIFIFYHIKCNLCKISKHIYSHIYIHLETEFSTYTHFQKPQIHVGK